jgi:hypothetical protein
MESIRQTLLRKRKAAATAELELFRSLRSAIPSAIKLYILDFVEKYLNVNLEEDSVGCIKPVDALGRFLGDSDRKIVLLFRSLKLDLATIVNAFQYQDFDIYYRFALKHARAVCLY